MATTGRAFEDDTKHGKGDSQIQSKDTEGQ